ncbi:MAG: phage major capsid protein [Verrucomicrobiae bacterium]|nr:phage major capsid protein [Verrucomicrobiae bacterium]
MAVLSKGSLFAPELVTDLVNKVKGRSSLAVLSNQTPIPFNGQKEFVFTMDSEIDVVAENGAKSHGGITLTPRTIVPIKVEYGARVSNEFMLAAEEEQIEILKAFNDGFARKVARGLDLMAMHGINPRTGAASAVIGTNHFDAAVSQTVEYVAANIDDNIGSAIAAVQGAGGDITGMSLSPAASAALAALKVNGVRLYPELAWGANPGALNGVKTDINKTVSDADTIAKDRAIVGDFENSFKWGYSKEIPTKIIEAGDPDNSGKDLNGYNQVYIRAELFLGWAVLEPTSFCRIIDAVE